MGDLSLPEGLRRRRADNKLRMGDEHYPKLTIRVTPDLLHRLDALVPRLSKDRALPTSVRPNRSSAARLALEIGLARIEQKHNAGKRL